MERLINQVSEQSWAEKYISEAIILEEGDKLQGDIPTYNIRIYSGNPDARSSDVNTGTVLKDVPVQVSREGVQMVDLEKGDRVLVGFFNNDLNSPYIMFNQTTTIAGGVVAGGKVPDGSQVPDTINSSDGDGGTVLDGNGTALEVVNYAKSFEGKLSYSQGNRYGINNGGNTADCSSYVEHVFAKFGYQVGSNTSQQYSKGEVVGNGECSDKSILNSLQLADIIIVSTDSSFSGNGAHAGIVVGEDLVIHMGNSNKCGIDSISQYFFANTRWKRYAVRRHVKLTKQLTHLSSAEIIEVMASKLNNNISTNKTDLIGQNIFGET